MGRHHEVRAAAMAKTGKIKSALYGRASKEAYLAAKQGSSDPNENLALRAVYEKYKGKSVPRDVFDRAIKKAQGGEQEVYIEGRYEFFGPGSSLILVDTLTDNPNRALVSVKTAIVRKGGHMGSVAYNFSQMGVLGFTGKSRDGVEENLILSDIDVQKVEEEDGTIYAYVSPSDFEKAKEAIKGMGVSEFETCEVEMVASDNVTFDDEEQKSKFEDLLDELDELEDVQNVWHNVNL